MISIDDDIVLNSGVPRSYACIRARWDTYDTLRAIWGACDMGLRPEQYNEPAFVFQHDTKEFRTTVTLPGSGQSLIDADAIEYRIYNPSGGATIISKTLAGGGVTIASATELRWTLDTSETNITPGHYAHELRITEGSAPATTMTGPFRVVDTRIGDA